MARGKAAGAGKRKRTGEPGGVRPRVKFWLEAGRESVLCSQLREILKAVESTGSIKQASATVGRSYRFVWARIKEAERAIGAGLVATQVGGQGDQRSHLTELARDLVKSYDNVRGSLMARVEGSYRRELEKILRRHGCP